MAKVNVKVWLGHDGYRDADDNLALLVGTAQAKVAAGADNSLTIAGFVYGDTIDGGQFLMLNPTSRVPSKFDYDFRYSDISGNKRGAGNYAFYNKYGEDAIDDIAPGWKQYNLLKQDSNGYRSWDFDAKSRSDMSSASWDLAQDIQQAIRGSAAERVVYSAGGGANVAAEAIGYLENKGFKASDIKAHFAVIQHSGTNWERAYEDDARDMTRPYTIAISDQNRDKYTNGSKGPGLSDVFRGKDGPTGEAFGGDFEDAVAVATGDARFKGLPSNASFRITDDASDAGSHAFAVDVNALLKAWGNRLDKGDDLRRGDSWAHKVDEDRGTENRVIYNAFDHKDVVDLMNEGSGGGSGGGSGSGGGGKPSGGGSSGVDTPVPASGFKAPFSTSGKGYELDDVFLFGFGANGQSASIGKSGNKVGVGHVGSSHEIDYSRSSSKKSEKIGMDFGGSADEIKLKLDGLGAKGNAEEAAILKAYDKNGKLLDAYTITNDTTKIDFDAPVRYATLEARNWLTDGSKPGADPDFSLVGIDVDYF